MPTVAIHIRKIAQAFESPSEYTNQSQRVAYETL